MSRKNLLLLLAWVLSSPIASAHAQDLCRQELKLSAKDCDQLAQSILPAALEPARGNSVADSEDAALLGFKIFYDSRYSRPRSQVSCGTCHNPEHAFSEELPRSKTFREALRNAPDLYNAARYREHFWDGRADSLWSAPLSTLENPDEVGASRLQVAHVTADIYKARYERIFGPMPDISDIKRFPYYGKPGMKSFDSMPPQDQEIINRIYSNVGKALEAYIRKLAAGRSRFDEYLAGNSAALNAQEKRGLRQFVKKGCTSCHSGPLLSDERYYNLGIADPAGAPPDPGRAAAEKSWTESLFTSNGAFFERKEAPASQAVFKANAATQALGAFRTPTLRNVSKTGPYGHNGSFKTLDEILDFHLKARRLKSGEKMDLVAFLRSLDGKPPQAPWAGWIGN